jgi:uncharacterized membrane protein
MSSQGQLWKQAGQVKAEKVVGLRMRSVTFRHTLDRLRVNLWFTPLVSAIIAIILAWVLLWVDGLVPNEVLADSKFILSSSSAELRPILLGMAGTTLATAGMVFSLLTLPLSTVAAQYGSRLLRVFLGDRTTQIVLGMFVGTFIYSIAVALSLPPTEIPSDPPQIAPTFGVYLMVATFGTLILLIHHISTMLQAPNIVAAAGAELLAVAQAMLETQTGPAVQSSPGTLPPELTVNQGYPIKASEAGYIQAIDPFSILNLTIEKDLMICLQRKPGHFVQPGVVMALVWPADRVNPALAEEIWHLFEIGRQRTPTQDIGYAVNQLVEVAVRAMSPAINDPFTAMTCLDYLGNGLALLAGYGERPSQIYYYDPHHRLRVVFESVTLDQLFASAFDMLRHASSDNSRVLLHLLDTLEIIGRAAPHPEVRQKLLRHVSLVEQESINGPLIEPDKQAIHQRSEAIQAKLNS